MTIPKSGESGFTLMEMLVSVALVALVYVVLFSLMSTSLRNVDRMGEHEKVLQYGQAKLNELILDVSRGVRSSSLSGRFDEKYTWAAAVEDFDGSNDSPLNFVVRRIRLAVSWNGGNGPRQYSLETLAWSSGESK